MISDPVLTLSILIFGAFIAAFVIGAVGFADALILNAIWLHIMEPVTAIPLIVICGFLMHALPLYKFRNTLDFSRLRPFLLSGIVGVPIGIWVLGFVNPGIFRSSIAIFLIIYGLWMLARPNTSAGERGGRVADGFVGLTGGFMGGFAGLSGVLPTLWAGIRQWPRNMQRGVYQPFVLAMHGISIGVFAATGMITQRTITDLLWCIPAILVGSWLGIKLYPHLDEIVFRKIILGLILLSGITLLL